MFEELVREMGKPDAHVIRFVYVKDGEWKEHDFLPVYQRLDCFSVTKSFTATAAGIAQDEGFLSIDDPIRRYLGDQWPADADERLERVTVRHLLTHTMGIDAGFLFDQDRYLVKDNWVHAALTAPLVYEPGTHFTYSNSTYYLLARVVAKAVGRRLDDYLDEKLMRPLGMAAHAWEHDPEGETFGAAGLFLSAHDLAKFGLLYLGRGMYEGKRIVSESWVEQATRRQTFDPQNGDYGLGFWLYGDLGFAATGAFNQIVLVMPEENAVLAAHGYDPTWYEYTDVVRKIRDAARHG